MHARICLCPPCIARVTVDAEEAHLRARSMAWPSAGSLPVAQVADGIVRRVKMSSVELRRCED